MADQYPLRRSGHKAEVQAIVNKSEELIVITTQETIRAAAESATGAVANLLYDIADRTEKIYRSRPFNRVNHILADMMRAAVVEEYVRLRAASTEGRRKNDNSMRNKSSRIGGDKLLKALQDPSTIAVAGADGIVPYVPSKLDQTAKFWRRLNFGTGKEDGYPIGGTGENKLANERLYHFSGGFMTGTVKIPNAKSRYSPVYKSGRYGFWPEGTQNPWEAKRLKLERRPNSTDIFFPFGRKGNGGLDIPYRGNVAWRYLNVMYGVFAREAPQRYRNELVRLIRAEEKKAKHTNGPFPTSVVARPKIK